MSDQGPSTNPPSQPPNATSTEERLALRRIELSATPIGKMINVIVLIAGAISLVVVVGTVAIALFGQQPVPEVLQHWGGMILGFYFGQFISLVKDYMGVIQSSSQK